MVNGVFWHEIELLQKNKNKDLKVMKNMKKYTNQAKSSQNGLKINKTVNFQEKK